MLNRWTRVFRLVPYGAALLLAVLLLAGCRPPAPEPTQGAPKEPVAAVLALAEALRQSDLQRYAELSLPPERHAQRKTLWQHQVATKNPFSAEQAEHYAELMQLLAAPDAEAQVWKRVEPRIAAVEQEAGPKWAMGVTMLSGFAATAIAANPTLSEAEKNHASGVVDAITVWAKNQAQFTDRERAKQAVAVAVRTARELDLPTLEAIETIEYEALLAKGGVAFRGIKAIATAYGIDVDGALSQVQAEVIQLDGPRARVRVRYPLLGETVTFEQPMILIDGGWYREDAIQALDAALAEAGPETLAALAGRAPATAPAAAVEPARPAVDSQP